jgi:hypothetical protein
MLGNIKRTMKYGRTMRCTEVAGRPLYDGKFTGRDIGDRGRYPKALLSNTRT